MTTSTTKRSWPSLVMGGFFEGIPGWVPLADVIAGAPLTPPHMTNIVAIGVTIAFGHAK